MSYAYTQYIGGDPARGQLSFDMTPAAGTLIGPGDAVRMQIFASVRDVDVQRVEAVLRTDDHSVTVGVSYTQIAKGASAGFPLNFAVPEAAGELLGNARTGTVQIGFVLWCGDGTAVATGADAAHAFTLLRYRLEPVFASARFARCAADGTAADDGIYVRAESLKVNISPAADASDMSICRLRYADEDGEEHLAVIDAAEAIAGYAETAPVLLAGVEFLPGRDHMLTLEAGDEYGVISMNVVVPRAFANFHQSGAATGGAAFGMFSGSTDGNPLLESAFPFRAYAGVWGADGNRIDGAASEEITALADAFAPYEAGVYPVAARAGKLVQLSGRLSPSAGISGSTTEHTMFSLPRAYWPGTDVYVLCQGSNYAKWLLHVSTDGVASFSRYSTSSATSAGTTAWLAFHAVWLASDYEGPVTVQRPAKAMTANSSQNCVASASSVHTSSWPAWRGFDFKETTAWVSTNADADAWLQLEMDVALKNIRAAVYARETKYAFNPVAGRILGSNDGSAWTEIGSFSGWDPDQSGGLLGEVVCAHETAYRFVRLSVTERTPANSDGSYVAVGYMKITGEMPE